jgi:hypothetical protein
MIVLVDSEGAIQRIVDSAEFEDLAGLTALERDVPAGYPETWAWNAETLEFEPFTPPRWRTARQVFELFTADEQVAILTSGIAEVIGLVLALQMAERVDLDSTIHSQGVVLLSGLGLLTPERAAQVLAGLPPELDP